VYRKAFLLILTLLLALTAVVQAQEITPRPDEEVDPNANISWPPPVYVLRGQVDIYGSANLGNMTNYFIEFRPLEFPDPEDEDAEVDGPWFPVTLPSNQPVDEDVLGSWNTETTADGLYEVRLTINRQGQSALHFVVSPLRVENEPSDFLVELLPTATVEAPARPTLAASPTAVDTDPRVTANVTANVRSGDGTIYPRFATLQAGQTAPVMGVSSTGTGWFYIQLPDGRRGWIAPSVVTAEGNIRAVPRIDPPPPPATATPLPTATPQALANLGGTSPALNPNPPICNQQFQVLANITNAGSARSNAPATVLIQDVHVASGQVQAEVTRTLPQLDPGQNFVVSADFTISTFYNEEHRIVVTIDVNNEVLESDKSNNVLSTTYVLQQGGCP
jgi:uncharacterized protein YgiM (DUF1202 family)